jgi:phage terminase large subunit-like protein
MKRYHEYARDVAKGKILACEALKQAVARFERDLAQAKKKGPWAFDEDEADRIIDFMECLEQFEEPFAGQSIKLEPWECFFLGQLYGWRSRETGRRRFKKAMLFMGRKQGKTILASGLTLYEMLTKDGIQAFSLATKQDISSMVLRNLKAFIAHSDELAEDLDVYAFHVYNKSNRSSFKSLSRDAKLDGLNPAYVIVDELASHDNGEAYHALTSGMGTRSEPLVVIITTAGYGQDNPMIEEYEYGRKILDGSLTDDSYLVAVYEFDKGDKWDDLTKLRKSCPNLDVSVPLAHFAKEVIQARAIPSLASEYKTKYCNLWQAASTTWISAPTWNKCASGARKHPVTEDELRASPCVIALDFSTIWDWTAASRYWHIARLGKYVACHRFYIPAAQVDTKAHLENAALRSWIEEGLVVATPGEVVDYAYLYRDLDADLEANDVKAVVFDPARVRDFAAVYGERAPILEFPQKAANMSPAAKAWEEAIVNGTILDPSPVLAWMVSCAINKTYADSGRYQITKQGAGKYSKRIDGVVTSIMGFSTIRTMVLQDSVPKGYVPDLSKINY